MDKKEKLLESLKTTMSVMMGIKDEEEPGTDIRESANKIMHYVASFMKENFTHDELMNK